MLFLDQHTRSQICDLSEACGRYWQLRGIDEERRREMQLELEQHFFQAAMDGKPPETVVGSNPAAFAEAWAREMHPRLLRAGALLLPGLAYALSVVSTTALARQMLFHASSFTLTLFAAYLLGSFGMMGLLLPLEGFLAMRIRTRIARSVLVAAVLVLGALLARSVGLRVNWGMVLLSWRWPLTLLFVALAVAVSSLEIWRRARQERTSWSRQMKLGRSALTFASSVVLLDLFLGAGGLVVFNFCMLTGRVL
jgi:hypothetical protein